jgi:hypothetical protein
MRAKTTKSNDPLAAINHENQIASYGHQNSSFRYAHPKRLFGHPNRAIFHLQALHQSRVISGINPIGFCRSQLRQIEHFMTEILRIRSNMGLICYLSKYSQLHPKNPDLGYGTFCQVIANVISRRTSHVITVPSKLIGFCGRPTQKSVGLRTFQTLNASLEDRACLICLRMKDCII